MLCNDDGIDSPGLEALERQFKAKADVYVVAPRNEQSAVSHSLTLHHPLRKRKITERKYSIDGTPTDCILIGLQVVLPKTPDIIVAGINRGPNLGADVTYSGTVAAALEGALAGINSIAVSLSDRVTDDFEAAAKITDDIVSLVLKNGLPSDTLLNVNIPYNTNGEVNGYRVTRLGKRVYKEEMVAKTDPRGRKYYWIGGEEPGCIIEAGTDFEAMENGKVSITPLHFDSTNHDVIKELGKWLKKDTT